ncbi:MAG TPA: tetratricopeptide repeat protein [Pyrinomonadaceae bacterium]|nr:tetratricopeptide repeat protein [Pyrinomonadaceae bacterium]
MALTSALGKIITFYSYKGGTGRSMLLANVAWILASKGNRVLVLDWDLEAPGLHRYFLPFLVDKDFTSSNGVIDFVIDYALNAAARAHGTASGEVDKEWMKPHANILPYATSLRWDFEWKSKKGTLDFVPAGRQGASYSERVNSFNWQSFYDLLGGAQFLEAMKQKMRSEYDYILIDSRTGVSDTAGICTVQMPDILVVCFTLNSQSIEGASTVARAIGATRRQPELRIFPVPTRTDNAELEKRSLRLQYARDMFDPILTHIPEEKREQYWGLVEVPYVPFYAYEEVLATFRDRPGQQVSLLAAFERLTGYLTEHAVTGLAPPKEVQSDAIVAEFSNETLFNYDVFIAASPEDSDFAEMLERRLAKERVGGRKMRLFRTAPPAKKGEVLPPKNQSALGRSRRVVLIVSPALVESDDALILKSWLAVGETQKLIPVYLQDAEIPTMLKPLRFVDFRNRSEFSASAEKLLDVIRETPSASESLPVFENAISTQSFTVPDIGFVPRSDREGHNLADWLRQELVGRDLRAIALWGPGGAGKTTLAAEVARTFESGSSRKVILVGTYESALPTASTLVSDILRRLNQENTTPVSFGDKVSQLRSLVSASTALIVLDGLERLPDREFTEIENALISSPPCPLLVTSRQRISSARNVLLTGLSPVETQEFLDRWTRVRTENTEFLSSERDRIYSLTDGFPLTLQLLLGYLNSQTDPIRALNDFAGGPEQVRESAFKLSIGSRAMNKDARITLLALSLFVPSASLDALKHVAGIGRSTGRYSRAVTRLKSLRLVEESGDMKRLSLHEIIRVMTRTLLDDSSEADQIRRRFIEYFENYVQSHSASTNEGTAALESERTNVLKSLTLAFEMKDWGHVIRIGESIALAGGWLASAGHVDDAIFCSDQSMRAAGFAAAGEEVVKFAARSIELRARRGEYSEAAQIGNEALEITRKLNNDEGTGYLLHILGTVALREGNLESAQTHYLKSLAATQTPTSWSARNFGELADLARLQGNAESEKQYLNEALKHSKNQSQIAYYQTRLGYVAFRAGKLDEARKEYEQALALFEKLNDKGIGSTLGLLGSVALRQGNYEEARSLLTRGLESERKNENLKGVAMMLRLMGDVEESSGNLSGAEQNYNESLQLSERLGDQRGVAYNLRNLGELAADRKDHAGAWQYYSESLEILRALNELGDVGETLQSLAKISAADGRLPEAHKLLGEALQIFQKVASPRAQEVLKTLESLTIDEDPPEAIAEQ